jgi:hypothetical protein
MTTAPAGELVHCGLLTSGAAGLPIAREIKIQRFPHRRLDGVTSKADAWNRTKHVFKAEDAKKVG